jgi:hypothetical protein
MPSATFKPTADYKANFAAIDWKPLPLRPRRVEEPAARSSLAFPMIIRDHIPPTFNHADGKIYESANSFKRGVKEAGKRQGRELEIVGDDPAFLTPKKREVAADPTLKHDIHRAMQKLGAV